MRSIERSEEAEKEQNTVRTNEVLDIDMTNELPDGYYNIDADLDDYTNTQPYC